MSNYQEEEAAEMPYDYDVGDMEDEIDGEIHDRVVEDSESDDEEHDQLVKTDTTAAQARKGKDIQGIPWDRLNTSREKYRNQRLEQYKNYENFTGSGEQSKMECKPTKTGSMYYEFWRNTRSVKSAILHFQLRNLVWATSKHDVYLIPHSSVIHWSALSHRKSEVLDVSGHVAPCENHPRNLREGFTDTQVSTLAIRDKLLLVGGFEGELICKYIDRPGVSFCGRITHDDNAITNSLEIYDSCSGATHFMAASNDCGVRDYDAEKFQLCKTFRFPWAVNHTSLRPDGSALLVVGDSTEGLLMDVRLGEVVRCVYGHYDYSFASAWHPNGRVFATGNQDKTCRIWDIRNLSESVAVLRANLGAIRSLRYSSDGKFLVLAEPADFVHIYDVGSEYENRQELDFFGEISGVAMSPDTEALFVGVWDRTYDSLLQFNRRRNYSYLDSLF